TLDESPFAGVTSLELRWKRPNLPTVIEHGSWPEGTVALSLTTPGLVDGSQLEIAAIANDTVVAVGRTPPLLGDAGATSVYVGLINQFVATPLPRALSSARFGASATVLGDGRVLLAGGATRGAPGVPDPASITALVDLYDPTAGTFTVFTTPSDFSERIYHAAGPSAAGGVIIAGGLGKFGPLDDVYAIDPTSSSAIGKLPTPRWAAASAPLAGGSLVVIGGYTTSDGMGGGTLATDALVVGPTGSVASVTLPSPRAFAVATPLGGNGSTFLVSGGVDATGTALDSALLFDASAMSFSMLAPTGDGRAAMQTPRVGHTATALPSGDVFVYGGNDGHESVANFELYSASAGGFIDTHVFNLVPRQRQSAVALPDGTLVLAGGESSPQPLATPSAVLDPLVYHPAATGDMGILEDDLADSTARAEASLTALIDGSLLYVGGGVSNPRTLAGGGELFVPCFADCLAITSP
ncbi:MAG TPA: kelch repeat-containing protein, partial [Polyangia bacterium]